MSEVVQFLASVITHSSMYPYPTTNREGFWRPAVAATGSRLPLLIHFPFVHLQPDDFGCIKYKSSFSKAVCEKRLIKVAERTTLP